MSGQYIYHASTGAGVPIQVYAKPKAGKRKVYMLSTSQERATKRSLALSLLPWCICAVLLVILVQPHCKGTGHSAMEAYSRAAHYLRGRAARTPGTDYDAQVIAAASGFRLNAGFDSRGNLAAQARTNPQAAEQVRLGGWTRQAALTRSQVSKERAHEGTSLRFVRWATLPWQCHRCDNEQNHLLPAKCTHARTHTDLPDHPPPHTHTHFFQAS